MAYFLVQTKTGIQFTISEGFYQRHEHKARACGVIRLRRVERLGSYSEIPNSSTAKPDLVVVPFARPATLTKGLPVMTYDGAGVLTYPVNNGWWWVKLDSGKWHIGRAEYIKAVEAVMEKAA